jgi:hypothetical protein
MKAMTVAAWKWILIAALVAAVGGLLLFGLGRKRGTRTYRWRMAMWTLALSLMGGLGFISLGASMAGCEPPGTSQCYAAVPPGDMIAPDSTTQPDGMVTCYEPLVDLIPQPDNQVMCYAPRPPDIDVNTQPDTQVMCYEPIIDVKEDATSIQPDMVQTCYLVALDVEAPDTGVPDVQVTCYAPLPPDWTEQQDAKEDQAAEDIPLMCYDPLPPDVKP